MSNNLKKERYSPVDPLLMEEAEVVEMNEILGRGEVPAMRVVKPAGSYCDVSKQLAFLHGRVCTGEMAVSGDGFARTDGKPNKYGEHYTRVCDVDDVVGGGVVDFARGKSVVVRCLKPNLDGVNRYQEIAPFGNQPE